MAMQTDDPAVIPSRPVVSPVRKPILAQFRVKDKYKAYRGKVQHYAEEEKSLWKDFRHGMIIETKEFIDRMRSKYIPDNFHKEFPQHRTLGKSVDLEKVLEKAARRTRIQEDSELRVKYNNIY